MLSASDPIDWSSRRILIAGVSGTGKSTFARRLAQATGISYTEMDALYHGPNWTPRETFLHDVELFTRAPSWITEWQYREARPLLLERADTLLWLDLPTRVTLGRVVRRTVRRRVSREELWNGNREGPLRTFFTDRDHIVRWAIRTRGKYRESIPALDADAPHVRVVRFRSQRELSHWLERLAHEN